MTNNYVGQRVKRTEDPRLIKGLAHYVDDIALPGTLHVAFVRSIYAHAKITGIDTRSARDRLPALSLFTPARTSRTKSDQFPAPARCPDLKVPDHRVLATNKVYFVGPSDRRGCCDRSLRSARRSRSRHGRL